MKSWDELSWKTKKELLSAKLNFIGCYNANFNVQQMITISVGVDKCSQACIPFQAAWRKELSQKVFASRSNRCVRTAANHEFSTVAHDHGLLDGASCQISQCECLLTIRASGILLSKTSQAREDPSGSKGPPLNPHGTHGSPYNCNASGFVPWLETQLRKLPLPDSALAAIPLRVSSADVVLDLVCEAFTGRFPPEAATDAGAFLLRQKARQMHGAERKEKRKMPEDAVTKAGPALKPLSKKRSRKVGICSTRPACVGPSTRSAQMCPLPEADDACYVPHAAPDEATPTVMQTDSTSDPQTIPDDFWQDLFPIENLFAI